jgi:hypothetical protein
VARLSFSAPDTTDIYVLSLSTADPDASQNGFDTAETVWVYITAVAFLLPPVLFVILLVVVLTRGRDQIMSFNQGVCSLLILFMIFRATLCFGLAAGTIDANSTTEFALSDVAVLCEFLGLLFQSYVLFEILLRTDPGLKSANALAQRATWLHNKWLYLALAATLTGAFIGILIAYGLLGSTDGGLSQPTTSCLGRVPAGEVFWTTQRILRFVYQMIFATCSMLLGVLLIYLATALQRTQSGSDLAHTTILRISLATGFFALAMLAHAIIAIILIATAYNNFIFGITLLWATELLPCWLYIFLAEWTTIQSAVGRLTGTADSSHSNSRSRQGLRGIRLSGSASSPRVSR